MSIRHVYGEKQTHHQMNGQHIWLSVLRIVYLVKSQETRLMSIVSQQYGDTY